MGRRLAEATKARFTRRTRGEATLCRFTFVLGFFAGEDFGVLAGGAFFVG
jgi:hypothetical protein